MLLERRQTSNNPIPRLAAQSLASGAPHTLICLLATIRSPPAVLLLMQRTLTAAAPALSVPFSIPPSSGAMLDILSILTLRAIARVRELQQLLAAIKLPVPPRDSPRLPHKV